MKLVRYSELERQTRAHNLLEFIAVGEVVLTEGSYSSLYILVIYMCVTEPSRNRRQESSGTFGSNKYKVRSEVPLVTFLAINSDIL